MSPTSLSPTPTVGFANVTVASKSDRGIRNKKIKDTTKNLDHKSDHTQFNFCNFVFADYGTN